MKFLLFIVLLWGLSLFAFAAELPPRIEISYLIKTDLGNGKLNETFEIIQESNRYRYSITSDARPSGLLKLIKPGSIVRDSKGTITKLGLLPQRFSDQRSQKLPSIAIFDWDNKMLTLQRKGEEEQKSLPVGTQDRLSLPYSFMFSPLNASHIDMHETDGHSLTLARYTVNQEILETPLGKLETIVLTKQQEKDNKVDRKIWLATAHHMLPVRIIATEKNGLELEQIVTKISYPYEH
tara:strand:- start:1951 stop:2661 length:711 start_codon:yes stop_codon:yes gene_type:complete